MRFRKRIIDINIDLNINTRPLDPGVIDEYAEAMEQYGEDKWQSLWKEMPKITHNLDLFSGFHTVHAAMRAFGEKHEIAFDVQGNTLRDAFFLATEQNAQHGRRRSNSEKRNIVLRWLLDDEMKEWTDGYIAEQCQVSQNFVTSVSNQLKSDLSGIDFPTLVFSDGKRKSITEYQRPSKRKFLGKGGVQWIETEQIGAKPPIADDVKAQLETEKNGCIRAQNAAYDKWHGICGEKGIPFDWDQFVAVASKEMGEFSLPTEDDTTPESVAEKSRRWHQLRDAISHRKRWVKSHLHDLEEKAKPRKQLLDEIMKLQIHQVSPLLPEQYRTEWKEAKEALKAAYPLYFSYANRNNLPIEKLKKMKNTLLRMKEDLQENGITKFLSDDYKERAAAHGELTQAWHKAKNAFNAHPLAEHMEFDDFDQEVEFHLELEEDLLCPDSVGGLEAKDLRRLKHLWDKIAKALEGNVKWVQKILEETKERQEEAEAFESAQASMEGAKASFLENREALGLADVSWEDFAERARIEFKRRKAETLRVPYKTISAARLYYLGRVWNELTALIKADPYTLTPGQNWIAEYADEVKRCEIFGEVVSLQSQAQEIWEEDLRGHVYWDAFNEAIAANIDCKLGEPITAAASVEELTEHIELWERALKELKAPADWVTTLKESGQAKCTERNDDAKRTALMEEIDSLFESPDGIWGLIPITREEKKVEIEQFFKVNYDAYQTYYWRDRLKIEALEKLRNTLEQIRQTIKKKGVYWLVAANGEGADMPEPKQSSALQIEPLGPSDSTPEAEGGPSDKTTSTPFDELDPNCKLDIRFAMDKVRVLSKLEGLPDTIITLSEQLYKALDDYALDYSADAGGE